MQSMSNLQLRLLLLVLFLLLLAIPLLLQQTDQNLEQAPADITQNPQIDLHIEIDARNISRGIIHSQVRYDCEAGPQVFWFPKWIPGIHAPRGAIENMAGLTVSDEQGRTLTWQRDPMEMHRFIVHNSQGSRSITIKFDYICNQASTNSRGVDSYGIHQHGVISWNNVVMYPDGYRDIDIMTYANIHIPKDWGLSCALLRDENARAKPEHIYFRARNLRSVMDSPIICGRHHVSHQLHSDGKPVYLDIVASAKEYSTFPETALTGMRNMVSEAKLLFGTEHFQHYYFLLICSDEIPNLGLEHLESSLNGVRARDFSFGAPGAIRVMSHEYVHSWCGKYRRPAGMFTTDFHNNKDTTLLWVYEGLTQYLGNVLAVRSGLRNEQHFQELLHYYISSLRYTNGRNWRSLADTATASYLLRGGSRHWPQWVRGQDYYIEGALIWLEADCLIRSQSKGSKSLDDFCHAFLGQGPDADIHPFTYQDVIRTLNEIHPYDWNNFFQTRVYQTQEQFNLDCLAHSGWAMRIAEHPDAEGDEIEYYYRSAYESIGVSFSRSGRVYRVLKDSPGYKAGFARNMQVRSINSKSFTPAVLHQALVDARDGASMTFEVVHAQQTYNLNLDYAEGPRYLVLTKLEQQEDLLHQILSPKRSAATAE